MDLPTFEAGLLRVTLRRNLKFAFDGNVTSEHGAGWCVSVSDMAQELPHAFARAFADELSSLLRQADLNPTTVLPCFETLSQKFQARSLPDITEPSPIVPSNVEPRSLEALSRTVSLLMDGLFGEKAGFVASSLKLQLSELLPHLHALVLNDGQAAEGTEGQFLMTEEVGKALFKKVCKHAMNAIDSVNRAAITSDVPPSPPEVSDGTVPVFTFGGSVPVVSAESIPTTTDEAKEESKTEKSGEVETSKDSSDPLLTDAAVSNLLITFLRKWAPGIWNTELASKMKLKVRYEDHVSCNVTLDGSTTATTTATTPTPITLNEAAKTEQENKPPPSSAILRDPQQGSHTCKNCSGLFNTCFGDYGFRNNEAFSPWQAGVSVNLSHYPESPNSNYCCHACEQNHSAQPATGRFGQPAPTTFGGGGFGEPAPTGGLFGAQPTPTPNGGFGAATPTSPEKQVTSPTNDQHLSRPSTELSLESCELNLQSLLLSILAVIMETSFFIPSCYKGSLASILSSLEQHVLEMVAEFIDEITQILKINIPPRKRVVSVAAESNEETSLPFNADMIVNHQCMPHDMNSSKQWRIKGSNPLEYIAKLTDSNSAAPMEAICPTHGLAPPESILNGKVINFGGVEYLDLGVYKVPVDLSLPHRRSQHTNLPKLLSISDLEPIECLNKKYICQSDMVQVMFKEAQMFYGSESKQQSQQTAVGEENESSAVSKSIKKTDWAEIAFIALDYSHNGTIGPEDFDLTARRGGVESSSTSPKPSEDHGEKQSDPSSSSSSSTTNLQSQASLEEAEDEFDELPSFDQGPRLRAHLSTWDGIGHEVALVGAAENRTTFEDEDSSLDVGVLNLDAAIANISDTLQLSQGDALLLLASNKWNTIAAIDYYVSDKIGARKLAGIDSANSNLAAAAPTECGVCFDSLPSNTTALACGHAFCSDCWQSQLEVKVKERPIGGVKCMWPKCSQYVNEEALIAMGVEKNLLRSWRRELARPFLEASSADGSKIVHCKNTSCKAVIRVEGSAAVKCGECNFAFCSACDFPAPHAPASCSMITTWQEKSGMIEASEEDMRNYLAIKKVSKRCPKCGHAIIKEPETCNHMTCFTASSGCGAHFCYLCQSEWDESNYRCTNVSGNCPSSSSGGGNIYAVQETQSVSEFDRLNEECASHIASLRRAAAYVTEFSKSGKKGLFSHGGGDEERASDALLSLASALVDSFRYLANAAVTLYSLPMDSPLRERLIILQAPLQRHAATSLGRLDKQSPDHLDLNTLKQEPQRLSLMATVSAMKTEMARCESEVQPLLTAVRQSGSLTSTSNNSNDEPSTDSARIPCEICGLVVKLSGFQEHVQRHGVSLNDSLAASTGPGFGGNRSANPIEAVFRVVSAKHAVDCVPSPPHMKPVTAPTSTPFGLGTKKKKALAKKK